MNVTIVYFSSSGKTQRMAEMMAEQLRRRFRVLLTSLDEARESDFRQADLILIGSPAWTGEQVVPVLADFIRGSCSAECCRRVALFGSYDWGDGRYWDALAADLRTRGVTVHDEQLLWAVSEEAEISDARVAEFLAALVPEKSTSAS